MKLKYEMIVNLKVDYQIAMFILQLPLPKPFN